MDKRNAHKYIFTGIVHDQMLQKKIIYYVKRLGKRVDKGAIRFSLCHL